MTDSNTTPKCGIENCAGCPDCWGIRNTPAEDEALGPAPQTSKIEYARPDGSRRAMKDLAFEIRAFTSTIRMPGDFAQRAEQLAVELEIERERHA